MVHRHQASAADPEFGVAILGRRAADQFDSRPDPAGILPAAATAADPFTEDRAGRHQSPIVLGERAGQRCDLTGGTHQDRDERSEQVGGNGQSRALGNVIDLADQFDASYRDRRSFESSAIDWRHPSRPGGTMPAATTAALSSPR